MEHRITATELARSLGDVLGRVRFRNDSFLIERNGDPVARLIPAAETSPTTAHEAFRAWLEAAPRDPSFADDLELVGSLDQPPDDPWAS
jgi:prevent-host-death family protein